MSDLLSDLLAEIRSIVAVFNASRPADSRLDEYFSHGTVGYWRKLKYPAGYLAVTGVIPNGAEIEFTVRPTESEDQETRDRIIVTRLMTPGQLEPFMRDHQRYGSVHDAIDGPMEAFLAQL